MSWYNEAIFYHIYPLGLTGAPKENDYGTPVSRLNTLIPWISHIKEIGCTALYIGPLFESVGHGYETTDYKKLQKRYLPALLRYEVGYPDPRRAVGHEIDPLMRGGVK